MNSGFETLAGPCSAISPTPPPIASPQLWQIVGLFPTFQPLPSITLLLLSLCFPFVLDNYNISIVHLSRIKPANLITVVMYALNMAISLYLRAYTGQERVLGVSVYGSLDGALLRTHTLRLDE